MRLPRPRLLRRLWAWVLHGLGAESFEQVPGLSLDSAFLAILGAAFTPIPYEVFTLASGSFGVPLPTLVIASLIGAAAVVVFVAVAGLG